MKDGRWARWLLLNGVVNADSTSGVGAGLVSRECASAGRCGGRRRGRIAVVRSGLRGPRRVA